MAVVLPVGRAMIWEDRRDLTPAKVYWGSENVGPDRLDRLPVAPFSQFEKDDNPSSPKARLTDCKKVKWTVKLGPEVHSDVAAPRLAWALGFGTVEGYYLESGKIQGVDSRTDLGRAKGWIHPDGSFQGGRFKRHPIGEVKDSTGQDMTWDLRQNPGVPPEQLSGLLIFNVMIHNWDAQPKNCHILHKKGANPENWYAITDFGAAFADKPFHKFDLKEYQRESAFIKEVSHDQVDLRFVDAIRSQANVHRKIPLAHAKWFRKQIQKLTDEEIQAAFDAAFATDGLNEAYASNDPEQIKTAREHELSSETRGQIAGFVAVFRAKIDEFL